MSWQPQEEGLNEVLSLLRNSSVANSEVQRAVSLRIEQLKTVPDFLAYLTFVLITCKQESQEHRAVAGLLLKNSFSQNTVSSLDPQAAQAMAYVKAVVIQGLGDPDSQIRQAVSTVITSLIAADEPGAWPQALEAVTSGMGSSDLHMQEGCFLTLEKICEDCPHKLDIQVNGQSYMDHLVPEFIRYSAHSSSKIRINCLDSLRQLLTLNFPSVTANIDAYMAALFARASDASSDVRRGVCMALSLLLQQRPDKIAPELSNVVDYVAYCTTDADELVALEACEFWLSFAEEPEYRDQLLPYLGKVAPLLLKGMVYSEYDLIGLDIDDEDEAIADNETDIKPRHYGGRNTAHGAHESNMEDESANRGPGQSRNAAERAFDNDDDDDDDDDYDYDDFDEGAGGEWNIRKCSAAAIDVMSVAFPQQLLEILLPFLKERLFSEQWEERESGILALGAIAEGCMDGLEPHLPDLVPWLIRALGDPKALVRSITCWTLGRFSSWIVQVSMQDKSQYFLPTMEGLLRRVLDGNKRVQEAGCSAFATFEEEAAAELAPFLDPILRNLTFAFQKYQQKNLLILYDALGTLADSVGEHLGQPAYLEILMPPLIERWQRLEDDDAGLVPLLECLSSIAISANQSFAPYCQPVYQRSLTIIQSSLQQYQQFEQQPDVVDEPDRTFIVVSLDLLSGLTQGLSASMAQLIEASQPSLLHVMAVCLAHYEPPIRQSAHALLGDLAIACWPLLKPFVPQIMPAVIEQIVSEPPIDCVSVCNNATWATGEIALQFQGDSGPFDPFIQPLLARLVPILLNPKAPKSLSENAAVTIGRMGLVTPALIAPQLESFGQAWCTALWEIKDNQEKDSAFRGFCMLISINPQGIQPGFLHFCNAVVKWQTPSAELDGMFRQILQGFRSSLGDQWARIELPDGIKSRLAERYGV